jgi:hypothetical protein
MNIAGDGVLGPEGFQPEVLRRAVGMGHGYVPLAGMGLQCLSNGGAAGALPR